MNSMYLKLSFFKVHENNMNGTFLTSSMSSIFCEIENKSATFWNYWREISLRTSESTNSSIYLFNLFLREGLPGSFAFQWNLTKIVSALSPFCRTLAWLLLFCKINTKSHLRIRRALRASSESIRLGVER